MQLNEADELRSHLVTVVTSFGLALSSAIRFGLNPESPNALKYRERVENDWQILGYNIANFVIWTDGDDDAPTL